MATNNTKNGIKLHFDLSFKIVGCAFEVHNTYGPGHKESVYQEAFEKELARKGIPFSREPVIKVVNQKTGEVLRTNYRPDFLIEDKIIVELKAVRRIPKFLIDQLYDYLRNSNTSLGI